jgi:membrane protein implicated in regulation of membrane protease activity
MFRGSIGAFVLAFVMLAAALASYGLNAPLAGALFLVAVVVCAVAGFVLAARQSNRVKAATRGEQQRLARQREPWQD